MDLDPIGIIETWQNGFVLNTSNPSVYATQLLGKLEKYRQKRPIPWGLITRFAKNLAGLKSHLKLVGQVWQQSFYDTKPNNALFSAKIPQNDPKKYFSIKFVPVKNHLQKRTNPKRMTPTLKHCH